MKLLIVPFFSILLLLPLLTPNPEYLVLNHSAYVLSIQETSLLIYKTADEITVLYILIFMVLDYLSGMIKKNENVNELYAFLLKTFISEL
jgi:hypothetical protein